jgi:transitional endoplasmic reticulum ATPase
MADFYAAARLVGVDPEDDEFWVAQYQNGNYAYLATEKLDDPVAGVIVLVSLHEQDVYPAPESITWGSPFKPLGTVKFVSDTHVVLEIGNVLRSIPRTGDVPVSEGDVLEIGDDFGLGDKVATAPAIERTKDELDPLQFEVNIGDETPIEFVGESVAAAVYRYVELPLARKERFDAIGVQPASGVLFVGPPGTGKTMIARSIAQTTKASFFVVNGPEIVSKWVGDAELALRNIFREAASRERAIIFFDEIDSIAPARTTDSHESGVRLVGMLLTLMSGFENASNVMVIGATNRVDSIDKALRRGGRFQAEVHFELPTVVTRTAILESIRSRLAVDSSVNMHEIVNASEGWSGSDLSDLWQQAGWNAAEDDRDRIVQEDVDIAFEQVRRQRTYRLEIK